MNLEEVIAGCEHLSSEEKAKLVHHLFGSDPGMQITFGNTGGNSQLHATTIFQINISDKGQVQGILEAIASQIDNCNDKG